uniref:aminotransferase class I/II-fold pyridoxal phosphate-dependent enzyme n=1 Tax=uncultured Amnibacterium sp. TaxID=1631851 RepID=UPI0035CB63DD
MAIKWADSGLDLHLERLHGRVRAGIVEQLRTAVAAGRLASGTRLPPTRTLAADLGVARNTVADAYSQLVAEGWLTARTGSGTVVADRPPTADAPPGTTPPPVAPPLDLRSGSPDLSAFPRAEWARALRSAVATAPADRFGYGDPRGVPELRAALAAYLARARGVHAAPGRVVVTAGFGPAGPSIETEVTDAWRTLAAEQPVLRGLLDAHAPRSAVLTDAMSGEFHNLAL